MNLETTDVNVACPGHPPEIRVAEETQFVEALSFPAFQDPPGIISLERKLAHDLKIAAFARGFKNSSQSRFAQRPATELVLWRSWPAMMGHTRYEDIDVLMTGLLGEVAVRRRHRSTTRLARDGTRSIFPPEAEAHGWLSRIDKAESSDGNPLSQACFAYAQTVLNHPYTDGNGRLARAMFQRSLGRSGVLSGPFLPLGPLVYSNHQAHDRALQHLGHTGDWGPFVTIMVALTGKASAFTKHIHSQKSRPS